ncbi:hypothetical protein C1645_746305 [Glomus cerebriforme]|uniref:Uncharacterized protein n=1 Tax=Glomus cerebriforme TaxID=658196 RepID=A0A397RXD2_9GLOM|nr:hypothetical protein C1645_746305 [Glomus cerebriforme]
MVYICGKNLKEAADKQLYLVECNSGRIMTFFFKKEDRRGALEAYLRALDRKIKRLVEKKDLPYKPPKEGENPCDKCQKKDIRQKITETDSKGNLVKELYLCGCGKKLGDWCLSVNFGFEINEKKCFDFCSESCVEEFKKNNQQACSQCQKIE